MTKCASEKLLTAEKVLIFLHIPKTAGITLNSIIDRQFPHDTIFDLPRIDRPKLNELKNLSKKEKQKIRCLRGHMAFGLHQWLPKPSVYITLLRDPVDRLISEYYHIRCFPEDTVYEKIMSENISFDDYVRRVHVEWRMNNLQTRWISGCVDMNDLMPPYDPLPMEALQTAKQNLSTFSVVGLTERFDETLLLMKKLLGWRNIFYTKQNVTRDRPSKSEISRKTIRIIEDSNKLDLELYEFTKQKLEERISEQGELFRSELRTFHMLSRVYGAAWRKLPQYKVHKAKVLIKNITAR